MVNPAEQDILAPLLPGKSNVDARGDGMTEYTLDSIGGRVGWRLPGSLRLLRRLPHVRRLIAQLESAASFPVSPLLRVAGWHRPIDAIVEELRALQDSGRLTREVTVAFTDCTFGVGFGSEHSAVSRDYALALFEALVPLKIRWIGVGQFCTANDEEWVAAMADSGGEELLLSFGNVHPSRNQPWLVDAVAAVDVLHSHGIAVRGGFSWGQEDDTPDVFDATLEFIEEHIDIPHLTLRTPLPESEAFGLLEGSDRILHHEWSKYDGTHVVFEPMQMGPQELQARYDQATAQLYSYGAIARRALRHSVRARVGRRLASGLVRFLTPNLHYREQIASGKEPAPSTFEVMKAALGMMGHLSSDDWAEPRQCVPALAAAVPT